MVLHSRFELLSLVLLLPSACGGSTSSPSCGEGTVEKGGQCVAVSAAGGGSANTGGSTSSAGSPTSIAGTTSTAGSTTSSGGSTSIGINPSAGAGGSGGSAGSGVEGVPGQACIRDGDCAAPLVCELNACRVNCGQTRDCPGGQRCIQGRADNACLLPAELACSPSGDCPAPLLCGADLQCRNQCTTDRDCLVGELCSDGECFELGAGGAPS